MSEVRRVLLANGQYIEIVQETGTSTGAVMSQNAVTAALSGKANASHNHVAGNITGGTFGSERIADGAITRAKLASDVPISVTQYETVTVTGACSDGSSIAGKQLSIGGYLCEFDGNGVVSANIPYGQAYTIRPIASNLYVGDNSYAFTASTASRSVTMNYSLIGYGVYIEDKQGRLYTAAGWDSGYNSNANSVVVMTNAHSFRIALQGAPSQMQMSADYNVPWYGFLNNTTNSGTTSETEAKADYSGAVNTQLIVTKCQSATTYAAGWSNAYTFPDGSKGYLPSLGELYLAYQNKAAIDVALAKCGGTALSSSYHWSSTYAGMEEIFDETGQLIRANHCWGISWRSGNCVYRELTETYYVRAFGAH